MSKVRFGKYAVCGCSSFWQQRIVYRCLLRYDDFRADPVYYAVCAEQVRDLPMITGCAIPAVKSFKPGLRKQRKRLGRRKFNKNLMQKPGEKHCCRQRIQ